MTRLHEGWDYLLYRIYIWGGLAALVAHIVVSVLVFDVASQPDLAIYVICGPITLYVAVILLYWWWVLLFKGNKELKESVRQRPESVPPLSALKTWNTLHAAMSLYGGSPDEMLKTANAARRPVALWYGAANMGVVWILGYFWLNWLGIMPGEPTQTFPIMLAGVFAGCGFMIFGIPFLLDWASRAGERAYLAPLGLSLVESPSLRPDLDGILGGELALVPEGAAVVEGHRLGRQVHIETLDRRCFTWVQATTPPFTIRSRQGKLSAEPGAPDGVLAALKGMRKAKRWRGIEVRGGSGGIGVQRESPGQNMWLYDLWLVERVLEGLEQERGKPG
jgi:hypothetical protein